MTCSCLTTLLSGRRNWDCRCRHRTQQDDHRRCHFYQHIAPKHQTSICSFFMMLRIGIVVIIASAGGVWIHARILSVFSMSVSATIFCRSISSIFRFIFIINPTRWAFSYPRWPFS
ncbi:hypothetical protein C8J56DRAFT_912940 [Mycena floridula]|nr:hypothetical protein C8J56DRAFT_912940 [Mycena floridula]